MFPFKILTDCHEETSFVQEQAFFESIEDGNTILVCLSPSPSLFAMQFFLAVLQVVGLGGYWGHRRIRVVDKEKLQNH